MKRWTDWLVGACVVAVGIGLALLLMGCAGSRLDRAILTANAAADVGDAASKALHAACTERMRDLSTSGKPPDELLRGIAEIDRFCGPATRTLTAYIAMWAALKAAIEVAKARGDASDVQLTALELRLAQAADDLSHALMALPGDR